MSNTMNSENSASQAVRFQDAQVMFNQGQLETRGDTAVIAEMSASIFKHRMAGRRSAEGYGKTRRLLTAEKVPILPWRCDILQRSGWLQTLEDAPISAPEIAQKRDPDAKVGKDWIRNSLHKRHPEMKLRWNQQLDRVRAFRGSKENCQAIKLFFDNVCPSRL